jgi:Fe-S cluster assembly protein SufD
MTQATDTRERFLSDFDELERRLNGGTQQPVHALRREAIKRFGAVGFPTTRDEEWRYTSVAPITRTAFAPVPGLPAAVPEPGELDPYLYRDLAGPQLVFLDGHFCQSLSTLHELPGGAVARDLGWALAERADLIRAHLARHAEFQQQPFTALNTAFLEDGAFIHIPRNAVVEDPIQVLFISTAPEQPTVVHPRLLVIAEENSQVTLVESYAALHDDRYLTNAVGEIVVGSGANVDHYRVQQESGAAFHVSDLQIREARDACVCSTCITLSGSLTRNHVHAALCGEGIDSTLNGLYLTDHAQHVDNHTLIEHCEPHCSSHEYYKGVLDGKSTGVFRGQILVHQKAQKTDAYQSNRNLLLSADADINTKPQLEIHADDVKCSHGATIGRLDQDAIFYLRSRGIGLAEAQRVLTRSFAGEIIDRVKVEPLRQHLAALVAERLSRISL